MPATEPSHARDWATPGAPAPAGPPVLGDHAVMASPSGADPAPAEPARGRGLRHSPVERLAPRTVGQLLDGGFEVLRYRFRTLAVVAAVVVLPLHALPTFLLSEGGDNPLDLFVDPEGLARASRSADPFEPLLSGFGVLVGLAAAHMVLGVAVTHLVVGWSTGRDPGPRETLAAALRRLPVALGAWVPVLLIKTVSALPCYLGLLLTLPLFSLLGPVVAAEEVGVGRAIRRTVELGRRRLGPLLGLSLLFGVVSNIVSWGLGGMGAIAGFVVAGEDPERIWVVIEVLSVAATVLMAVVLAATTALAYLDARVRTEGLDLELELGERFGRVG